MKKISIFILCLCIMLTGCGTNNDSKEVGSIDNFQSVATNQGLNVSDNTDTYSDVDYITQSKISKLDDITIEMTIYTDNESAIKAQDSIIDNFMMIKSTGATQNRFKGQNYYKFWMVSNGYYMVSSRIDNTIIFSKTLLKNKEKVESLLDAMNY